MRSIILSGLGAAFVALLATSEAAHAQPVADTRTYAAGTASADIYRVRNGFAQSFTVADTGTLIGLEIDARWTFNPALPRTFLWELRATGPAGALLDSGAWQLDANAGTGSGMLDLPILDRAVSAGTLLFFAIKQDPTQTTVAGESELNWLVGDDTGRASFAAGQGFRKTFNSYAANLADGTVFDLRLVAHVQVPCNPNGATPAFAPGFLAGPGELDIGTTSVTFTSQVAAESELASITANGIAGTITPPNAFTVTVPVDADTTSVTFIATDACGLQTVVEVPIVFASVCSLPLYDECIEGQGTVFYISLVGPADEPCLLMCSSDAPGLPLSCDPDSITCTD